MNFNFKVIARSFPAIALVISVIFFLVGESGLGALFLLVAVGSFIAVIFARRNRY